MSRLEGVYVPLVTPFYEGAVDVDSLRRLVTHYAKFRLGGLIVLGTTGESPTVEPDEQLVVVNEVIQAAAGSVPVFVGVGGSSTRHVAKAVRAYQDHDLAGYLVVTPYYNRPPADGMVEHFCAVAAETDRPVILYNVPYRTGVNLPNDAVFKIIANAPNVRAIKDSTGNITQSLDLLHRAPTDFSVLTGEDPLFFTSLANGAAGGILASSHLATQTFVDVAEAIGREELVTARQAWRTVSPVISQLFGEANPMPVKHCLWRQGLIRSPECRLPLTRVSANLAATLDELTASLDGH